jgi:hypothetical protein
MGRVARRQKTWKVHYWPLLVCWRRGAAAEKWRRFCCALGGIAATPCCFLRAFVFTWQQGGRLQKKHIFFLFSFLSLSFEFQILSARFRVLNPYQVPISNLTLTLTCSALKVQLLHKLLFIVFCEHAQLLAIIAAKLFSMYTLNVFILLLAHRLKPPPLAFAIWAAATLVTCSQWATCK